MSLTAQPLQRQRLTVKLTDLQPLKRIAHRVTGLSGLNGMRLHLSLRHADMCKFACNAERHQMGSEGLPPAVPESVHKDLVVLDGDRADSAAQVKGAPLEHDTVFIVHACALREDEKGCGVSSGHMGLHPLSYNLAILHLQRTHTRA